MFNDAPLLLPAVLLFSLAGNPASVAEPTAAPGEKPTLVEALAKSGRHARLVRLIERYGVTSELAGEGPFTVFAPTDAGLRGLTAMSLRMIAGPFDKKQFVADILRGHVVKGSWSREKLATTRELRSLTGRRIEVEKTAEGITVNGLLVEGPGMSCTNGMAYALPRMMMPLAPASPTTATGKLRFPASSGNALDGDAFSLPGSFEKELNLVILAFEQLQQLSVDTWVPLGKELEAKYANFRYYELPVIRDYGPVMRKFTDDGMRSGIPNPDTRSRTITIYTDVAAFLKPLGIGDDRRDRIHTLLVTKDGRVLWHAEGPVSREAMKQARAFLKQKGRAKIQDGD